MSAENNKLIAEFMGIVFTKDNKANHPRISAPYPPIECFKYHSDWNWLMEVVEKIENLPSKIKGVYFWATDKETEQNKNANQKNDFTIFRVFEIQDLYNQVIEFIKWYNQQKQ